MGDINDSDTTPIYDPKAYNELNAYFDKFKVGKGEEHNIIRWGNPFMCSSMLGPLEYAKFLNMYKRLVGSAEFNYLEVQQEYGPLIIDIDIRQDDEERIYTNKHIKTIVKEYNKFIKQYLKYDEPLEAFVFEKEMPSHDEKQKNYKDGFHIMYPIGVHVHMRYLLFHCVKQVCTEHQIFADIDILNTDDEIWDKSVVMNNRWLLYGSNKPGAQLYALSAIYDENCKKIDVFKYSVPELIDMMSVRRFDQDSSCTIIKDVEDTPEFKELYDKVDEIYISKRKKVKNNNANNNNNNKQNTDNNADNNNRAERPRRNPLIANQNGYYQADIDLADKLIKVLSPQRATGYFDWIQVCWAAKNIDETLYDAFIEFSKKCPGKFDINGCYDAWHNTSAVIDGYTIASIHWWARQDNKTEYMKIMRESIMKTIGEAESGTHDDIARVIYELYKHQFRCANVKKDVWYEFRGHRWNLLSGAHTLKILISTEIAIEFNQLASLYHIEMGTARAAGKDYEQYLKKGQHIDKIITKLKQTDFRNSVVSACAVRFYEENFEEKLDSKTDIIGFDNGVYDLANKLFRNGCPDDYVTMTTGYPYKEYNDNDPMIKDIHKYISEVFREPEMQKYYMMLCSAFIDGNIKQQIFPIFTGSGSNSKSISMDLVKNTLGDYFGVLPTTIITRRRGNASNATPELADKRGKRCLVIQEPEHDDVVYVGFMKELTGGDAIMARPLYGDPFEYRPQFKMVLICNKMPSIPATDNGTWRRIRAVPFESEFIDRDPKNPDKVLQPHQFYKDLDLPNKLKKWKQPFMWLLLNRYYQEYRVKGLPEPDKVMEFTLNFQKVNDIYMEFITSTYEITKSDDDSILVKDLYDSFKSWVKESNPGRSTISNREFQDYFISKGFKFRQNKYMLRIKSKVLDEDIADDVVTTKKKAI